MQKYKSALEKVLTEDFQKASPQIEIICILGKRPSPKEREEENRNVLEAIDARYITYDVLIEEAINSYSDYLVGHSRIKKVIDVIERMADEVNADIETPVDDRPEPAVAKAG